MSIPKNKKKMRNQPVLHDEVKTRHNITVTPSAWLKLNNEARKQRTSISELIEAWAKILEGD